MSTSRNTQGGGSYAGDPDYPVFPHPRYISKFYRVSAQNSGLTRLDKDLYNQCYLPYNRQSYVDKREARTITVTQDNEDISLPKDDEPKSPRPTYQLTSPPCKRTSAINANCYFQNTNGTFSGLQPYQSDFEEQQKCYCEIYPYFDSAAGCNECFHMHGGIAGFHWFPQDYISAASSAYCNANPITTAFYPFISSWSKTAEMAKVPTTTAPNILGTQTEQSLYWTYAAAMTSKPNSGRKSATVNRRITWLSVFATVALTLATSASL
ncbi:hypothetical protein TWF730_010119 [Orbilia blumenaviensis]|uniref:Uncharacterized protein n=1 Tax=Orbilia blumenaviensis TaxID=1796055 RepID=A0AAV9UXW3_9PEZI